MEPADRQTSVNTLDFNTPGGWSQHLNKGKQVVAGADLAGEQKDKLSDCVSESVVINEDEITSFPAVKLWAAT